MINLDNFVWEIVIDLVVNVVVCCKVDYVLLNSFGFGGINVSFVMGKV